MSEQTGSHLVAMRLRPSDISIEQGAPFKNDKLGREPFVSAVSQLLRSIQEPFSIAINAPWGSGKSTTLEMLEAALRAENVTTVRFNAWEVDYATDPLVPLVATLHERLLMLKGYRGLTPRKVDRLKAVGGVIAKHAAVATVKIVSAGMLNGEGAAAGLDKLIKETVAETSEKFSSDVIDAFIREKSAAAEFRKILEELTAFVRVSSEGNGPPPPLVLMIDELDRCRPPFAIAMLERIKHFFQVPGLVFVLAVDLDQMAAGTCKLYGNDIDAKEYLKRFIDLELRLPEANPASMIDAMLTSCGADEFFTSRTHPELRDDRRVIVAILTEVARSFNVSARTIQRIVSRLMLVVRQTGPTNYLDPLLIVFMLFLRVKNETLLRKYVQGRIKASDVMEALRSTSPRAELFHNSRLGILIEAHLLYSHHEKEYVHQLQKQAEGLVGKAGDAPSQRLLAVASKLADLRNAYALRGSIGLADIDKRINLVSVDLADTE